MVWARLLFGIYLLAVLSQRRLKVDVGVNDSLAIASIEIVFMARP